MNATGTGRSGVAAMMRKLLGLQYFALGRDDQDPKSSLGISAQLSETEVLHVQRKLKHIFRPSP